ncbi:MAG: DUF4998 domain-containing protein [Bacteroidia bacterium]|nr:DUF4998 domain-containing protein [Bacteroidia bacterium]
MKSNYIYRLVNICIVIFVFLSSCSKMNDLHDKYLQRGETLYVGKPDSVKVLAGRERIKIRFWSSDPKAVKLAVYWLSRSDSAIFDIPPHLAKDSVEIIIPNLPESNYSFELVTMNKDFKNRSVTFQASGSSFGDRFQASLTNRVVQSSRRRLYPNYLETKWFGAIEKAIGCEFAYVNTLGVSVKKFVPITETTTLITNLVGGVNYRTLFLPTASAIDTFYTAFIPVPIDVLTEEQMNKSLFLKWNPTGIPYTELSATYTITKLWDNLTTTWYTQNTTPFPYSFTFDMGKIVKLRRFMQWQQLTLTVLYRTLNVKKFQLWGSDTPNVSNSFVGWVKLGDFVSVKPSGLPLGQESAADIAYATAGENFTVDPNAPPVRYIRYVVTECWGGLQTGVTVSEMTFFEYFF